MPVKGTGVIYLQRDKFQIYTSLQANPIEFRFVPDIVRDMDVVNKDLFENIVKIFIQTNKIPPSNLTIVLSDTVCFVNDILLPDKATEQTPAQPQSPDQKKTQDAEDKKEIDHQEEIFLDHVPFESVASTRFPLQKGIRIYATNEELFDEIITTFEKEGFTTDSVLPGALFGNNINILPTLTPIAANLIIQNSPALKQYNLLSQQTHESEKIEPATQPEEGTDLPKEKPKPKTDKKRLIVLGSVFGVLIIILIVVYISSTQNASTQAQQPVSSVETIPQGQ